MNAASPSSPAAEISPLPDGETEPGTAAEQNPAKPRLPLQADAERIKDSVARLTSNSIDGLEGLMSELQHLQEFLKSEVERVQGEIESALAGINIIVETIAPWKSLSVPVAPAPTNTRPIRLGPAANIEALQSRR